MVSQPVSYQDMSVQVSPHRQQNEGSGTAGIQDEQLLHRARTTTLFRSFFQRMMYFRAGSAQDINVARVQVLLVNPAQVFSKPEATA